MENMRELEIVVRPYEEEMQDRVGVEAVYRSDVGTSKGIGFLQLGDPDCRIRHTASSRMLVAEKVGGNKEIVGVIRGTTKTISFGSETPRVGYILGLHVSYSHRRLRIGFKLIRETEDWFTSEGAEYAYMATGKDNIGSISLFTKHCGYIITHTPVLLVQNILARPVNISQAIKIFEVPRPEARNLYTHLFSTTDFFPTADIDSILHNQLSQGTYLAAPSDWIESDSWPGVPHFLAHPPESWSVLSAWDCDFKIKIHGVSIVKRAFEGVKRMVDWMFPRLKINSYQGVFHPFWVQFLYGLSGRGTGSVALMEALCGSAHNKARKRGCTLIITEVADQDPLKLGIPHNKDFSCEDIWCTKRLSGGDLSHAAVTSIFVDPREF